MKMLAQLLVAISALVAALVVAALQPATARAQGPVSFTPYVATSAASYPIEATTADIDGMSATLSADEITWYENIPVVAAGGAITVTTINDVVVNTDGQCSLREAITAANTDTASSPTPGECPAGSGADTIYVPAGTYRLTVQGNGEDANQTGDLDITGDVTILGDDPSLTIIDGSSLGDRLLHVISGKVALGRLALQGANTVVDGAGIFSLGDLTVDNALIQNNVTVVNGGGIYMDGRVALTLTNSAVVYNNRASSNGGGLHLTNGAQANLNGGQIISNSAPYGGGVFLASGGADLKGNGALILSNRASTQGGGLYADFGQVTIVLTGGSVYSNTTFGGGGGLYLNSQAQ
ncbi:MAG: CSLREA domain-containing protein, partial [Anaerolineae bacterium]